MIAEFHFPYEEVKVRRVIVHYQDESTSRFCADLTRHVPGSGVIYDEDEGCSEQTSPGERGRLVLDGGGGLVSKGHTLILQVVFPVSGLDAYDPNILVYGATAVYVPIIR